MPASFKGSRTKLIATLGPSTGDRQVLRRMFREGLDVCRLNLSHGSRDEHARSIAMVREMNSELGTSVAVLADLQGPKIRTGEVAGGAAELKEGSEFLLLTEETAGNAGGVTITYKDLPSDVDEGDTILLDDGRIQLSVVGTNRKDRITTRVVHGGELRSRKGVNLPSTRLSVPSMTDKDREDVSFAVEQGVDWFALSFVRSADDIADLRKLLEESGSPARIVAKVEKPEALDDLDRIIGMADAVMVARGDLGVEVDFHRVPMIQKTIVRKCIRRATPVIIATQMMESMITSHRPTRAEAADVANAVLDGADCLMLSGETAVGRYPDLVVGNMQRIIDWTEAHEDSNPLGTAPEGSFSGSFPDSICYSAVQMADQTGAGAIITFTHSGYTALRISSHRPSADIFAFTMNRQLLPMLSMVWGVRAFYLESSGHIEDYVSRSTDLLREKGLADPGEIVVHVGSIPLQEHGKTNMLKLSRI